MKTILIIDDEAEFADTVKMRLEANGYRVIAATDGKSGLDLIRSADMAMRVVDGCLQLHGGYGYTEEYPVARAWRDMRVLSIFAGTNEIMKTIIAKQLGL